MRVEWLPSDGVEELQAFIEEHWRRGHRLAHDGELLRWQHRVPGDPGRLGFLVARAGGRIVGALGTIVVSFGVAGRRVPGAWLTTWIATPAAREGQGGLRLLRHVLEEPLDFVGTTGANPTALRIYRALGFAISESVPRWVRVIDEEALATMLGDLASRRRELPGWPSATEGGWEPPRSPPATGALRVSTWSEEHAERWDELWERRLAPSLTGTWRDAAYLRWRYVEHPRFAYAVRVAEDPGGLRGVAVHRVAEVSGAVGRVVRILELHGDAEAMGALAADALAAGARAGAAFAEMYCTAGTVAQPLGACGFTVEPQPTNALPALIEPLNLELPAALTGAFRAGACFGGDQAVFESSALYVTRGDCDQDRPQ
jgi:hypothetical protein